MTAQVEARTDSDESPLMFVDALRWGFDITEERAEEIAAHMRERHFLFHCGEPLLLGQFERKTQTYHFLKEYLDDSVAWELSRLVNDSVVYLCFTRHRVDTYYTLEVRCASTS